MEDEDGNNSSVRRRGLTALLRSLTLAHAGREGGMEGGSLEQQQQQQQQRSFLDVLQEEWTEEVEKEEEEKEEEEGGEEDERMKMLLEAAEARLARAEADIFSLGEEGGGGGGGGGMEGGEGHVQGRAWVLLLEYRLQRQHVQLCVNHMVRTRGEVYGALARGKEGGREEGRLEGGLRGRERECLLRLVKAYVERLEALLEEAGEAAGEEEMEEGEEEKEVVLTQTTVGSTMTMASSSSTTSSTSTSTSTLTPPVASITSTSTTTRRRKKRAFPPPSALPPPPSSSSSSSASALLQTWLQQHWSHPYPSQGKQGIGASPITSLFPHFFLPLTHPNLPFSLVLLPPYPFLPNPSPSPLPGLCLPPAQRREGGHMDDEPTNTHLAPPH